MEKKEYLITNSRFKLIVVVMIFIWISLLILFFLKTEEMTNHPCELCAKKIGKDITCYAENNYMIIKKTFYSNLSDPLLEEME